MRRYARYEDMPLLRWNELVEQSSVSTWFQTPEAFRFYASVGEIWKPFICAVENEDRLKGVAIGWIQKDGGKLKQFLSRRAIIPGGPLLANDITEQELRVLLSDIKDQMNQEAIYVETRNFNDYGCWRQVFEECGFGYYPHLNFHVHCTDMDEVDRHIGKHRRRYIRMSLREGATIVEYPTLDQVRVFYSLLEELYRTKVKTPLYPWHFFQELYNLDSCRYLLISYEDQIIGGSVCVCLKDRAVYEWFACGKDGLYKGIHPSSVTKYAGLRYAHDNGFPIFDMMGAGTPDEKYGVRDFKAEFGGELVEHGRFRHVENSFLFNMGRIGVQIMKKF